MFIQGEIVQTTFNRREKDAEICLLSISDSKMTRYQSDRGALIVLEGCDRAGKSTQCERLLRALQAQSISCRSVKFPGQQIFFSLYYINKNLTYLIIIYIKIYNNSI
jgi:polyphosphate kinase 2 (PPK2 family)